MNLWKLWLIVLVLPLILVVASYYEGNRIAGFMPTSAQKIEIVKEIRWLRADADRLVQNPENNKSMVTADDGFMHTPSDAALIRANNLEWYISGFNKIFSHQCLLIIGYIGVALAICTILLGLLILIKVRHWRRNTRQSMAELLQAFNISQQQLPKLLTALILMLSCSAVPIAILELDPLIQRILKDDYISRDYFYLHSIPFLFIISFVSIGFNVVKKINRAFKCKEDSHPVQGIILSDTRAPKLWHEIKQIANQLNTAPPHQIVLGFTDSFYVTQSDLIVQPSATYVKGQTLYLPACQMLLLSPDEIKSIIAHELGHFSGEDLNYTQQFLPLYFKASYRQSILENKDTFGIKVASMINQYVLDSFHLAIRHWSRIRELAADQAAKYIKEGNALATALLRLKTTDKLKIAHYQSLIRNANQYLNNNKNDELNSSPSNFALTNLFEQIKITAVDKVNINDLPLIAHPTDTHPPTKDRIIALVGERMDDLSIQASRVVDNESLIWLQLMIQDFGDIYQHLAINYINIAKKQIIYS